MAMFARQRDVSLVNHLNREVMGNIITQQCAIYQYKLEETKVNIYGEAAHEKFYNGPFLFNVLINRQDEAYGEDEEGIQATIANQYWSGKNPSYPNNNSDGTPNPLNPNLDLFGANLSVLVSTYYIPADKVAISPYKERF